MRTNSNARNSPDRYREFYRRQHRIMGLYLVHHAWRNGWECVVVERRDLEVALGLKRITKKHIQWLADDIKAWFSHHRVTYVGKPSAFEGLFLSRRPLLPVPFFTVALELNERVEWMNRHPDSRIATGQFAWGDHERLSTEKMADRLRALASGTEDPDRWFEL